MIFRSRRITDFSPPEAGKPATLTADKPWVYPPSMWRAEIGNGLFVATADGGDDTGKVGVSHDSAGRQAYATVK
jgi:hypothetical protein